MRDDARRPALPEEAQVLADGDVGEGVALPEAARVAERGAVHPRPRAGGIDIAPGQARGGGVEVDLGQAGDVGVAGRQRRHLRLDPRRRHPVVVVPVHDHLGAGRLAGEVALGAERELAIEAQVADALVDGQELADRPLAVVDDDELPLRVALAQEMAERARHQLGAIAGGHDAGHPRRGAPGAGGARRRARRQAGRRRSRRRPPLQPQRLGARRARLGGERASRLIAIEGQELVGPGRRTQPPPAGRVEEDAAGEAPRVAAVAHVDEQIVVGQRRQAGALGERGAQEVGVLAQVAGRIADVAPPHLAAIDQRAAGDVVDEHARVQGRAARPQGPRLELEEAVGAQRRDVGGAAQDGLELAAQPRRRVPVVVVPLGDDVAAGLRHPEVALGAQRHARGHPARADGRRAGRDVGKRRRQIGLVLVDDDQLALGIVLGEEVADRLRHEGGAAAGHHHAADQRRDHGHPPRAKAKLLVRMR